MDPLHLTVLGEPSAQPRHRHFARGSGDKTFVQTYDPAMVKKKTFASIVEEFAPNEPISGPIQLECTFYMSRPKNHYGTGKNASQLKKSAPEWHTGRPDADNLNKFIMDSLNKIFWKDDSQISCIVARKLYSEKPRTEITISTLI